MDSATVLAPDRSYTPTFWFLSRISRDESISLSTTRKRWCRAAWLFIGLVSAYDAWLVKAYEPVMYDVEKNPLAKFIIVASGNAVEPFLCCKAAGTLLVLTILWLMYRHAPRLALPVIDSLAAFQLLLLAFLHLAEH